MKSLKKNLTYQTIYQVLIIIIPLITSPYLSRVLGAEKLGIYSYTLSIVSYFTLFAMLGITDYGCRTIAMAKNKKDEVKQFNEIYTLQLINSGIFVFLYFFITLIFFRDNLVISLIQGLCVLSCLINVDWYFFGKEDFKSTVTRNFIVKIINISCIFIFVKKPEDIIIYTLIMALGTFISQLILWVKLKKEIIFKVELKSSIFKHFKPIMVLFVPLFAMSIYHILDKTMLGVFSTFDEVGYYYNADKVVNIPLRITMGISTVMLSKSSVLRGNKKDKENIELLKKSISVFMFITCAMTFGIASISKDFIPVFFGKGFDKCIILTIILSLVMIFKTLSSMTSSQYLIPYKKEKVYINSVLAGAVINIITNYLLLVVLKLGALGAVIGTVIAELTVTTIQIIVLNRYIKIKKDLIKSTQYIIAGAFMFICVTVVTTILTAINMDIIVRLLIEIVTGGIIYLSLSFIIWRITKNNEIINIIIQILRNTKKKV